MAINPVVTQFTGDSKPLFAELNKVRSELTGFSSQIKRIAATAVAGFSVAALTNFVRSSADAADQLGKTADKLDLSTRALTAFDLAAQDAGVSLETAHRLLQDSQKRLGEAAAGSGEAAKYLKLLNLNVKELGSLSPDELFNRYSDAISKLQNRSERMAAAQALLGKSSQEAFNLIESGQAAIAKASATVDRYGLALSRVDIAKIEQANDKLELLGKISQTAGQRIAAGLAPFVSAAAEGMLEAAGNTEGLQRKVELFGAAAYAAFQVVANAARTLQAAFFGIAAAGARVLQFITFGDVSDAFKASVDENLAKANDALLKIKSIEDIQRGIVDVLEKARTNAGTAVKPAALTAGASFLDAGEDKERQARINLQIKQAEELEQALTEIIYNEAQKRRAAAETEVAADIARAERQEAAAVVLAQRAADERAQIKQNEQAQILAFTEQTFAAATTLASSHNHKLRAAGKAILAVQKADRIAETFMNTRTAVMATYAHLGYPWGIPAAVAVAALGAAQIAAIASGGSAGGGVGSAGGSVNLGSPPGVSAAADNSKTVEQEGTQAQRAVQVIFAGPVYGMSDFKDQMINMIREEVDGRDVVIVSGNSRQAMEIRGT